MKPSISPSEPQADSLSRRQCDPVEADGRCESEHKPASRISAFYWQDFMQPFVPVPVLVNNQVVRGIYTMAAQSEPIVQPKRTPQAQHYHNKKAGLTTKRNATRVNQHNDIAKSYSTNSERAPR